MTFVMANCGGHNHFRYGLIRNSQEREIMGTVQDILETRDVVKDVTTKYSACHQRERRVYREQIWNGASDPQNRSCGGDNISG